MSEDLRHGLAILWLLITVIGLAVSFINMRELLRYYVIAYQRRKTNIARRRYFHYEFWAEFVRVIVKLVFFILGVVVYFHFPSMVPVLVVGLLISNLSLLINSILQHKGRNVLRLFVRQVQNHERLKYPQGGVDGPES